MASSPRTKVQLSPHSDPFWHPRTPTRGQGGIHAPIAPAVMPQIAPPTTVATKQRLTQTQARRPQCTHVTMNRIHGESICQMCGRIPSVGWLYRCMQDHQQQKEKSEFIDEGGAWRPIPDESDYYDFMARQAESLHMSASVVEQMRAGAFTMDQIDKLIAQKEHLDAVLVKAQKSAAEATSPTPQGAERSHERTSSIIASVGATPGVNKNEFATQAGGTQLPMTPAGTPTNTPSESTDSTPTKSPLRMIESTGYPRCGFQVCHACRPFFRDRLYQSFEAVLYGNQAPITEEEVKSLPLLDPNILRFIGLRKPPHLVPITCNISQESMDIVYQQLGANDSSDESWTPSSGSSNGFDRESDGSGNDQYPCPGAGICPLFSRESGCAYDNGFVDGNRAVNHGFQNVDLSFMRQSYQHTPEHSRQRLRRMGNNIMDTPAGTSSTASSISLPTPITLPLTPTTSLEESFNAELSKKLKIGKAASVCGVLTADGESKSQIGWHIAGKDSNSSLGSEVEVEGGVALTEEAVGAGTPDITTDLQSDPQLSRKT